MSFETIFCSWPRWRPVIFLLWLSACAATTAQAQLAEKQFAAVFTSTPPVIDGILDDEVWQSAAVIEDFHEVEPDEYSPPEEKLRFRVLYDEDNLYVGAEINMHVDEVTAFKLAQGSNIQEEDRLKVVLDPYNNKRTGYDFRMNANGVREEGLFGSVGRPNTDWNGIWDGRTNQTDEGWTAELAIPFKTLNFDPNNEDWGISFSLNISGRNEQIAWTSQAKVTRPGSLGLMTGVNRAKQGRGLDILPSVSLQRKKDFVNNTETLRAEPSIDVLYKITPLLTAALTVNTDFSAAEVDDRVINLDRFSVFFPEKRTFFLQDADIFSFASIENNGIPFFSRRIGLDENREPVDIIAGGKLTGRIGPVNVGILNAAQDAGPDDDVNLFVGRAYLNVLDLSTLGLIFTDGSPDPAVSNSVVGVDFNYINRDLFGHKGISSSIWYQQSDTTGVSSSQDAYGLTVSVPRTGGFYVGLEHLTIGENFAPALGFVNRTGIHDTTFDFGYTHLPAGGFLQQIDVSIELQQVTDLNGNTESELLKLEPFSVISNTDDLMEIAWIREREILTSPFEISNGVIIDVGDYSWNKAEIEVRTGDQRMFVLEGVVASGDFYDGDRFQVTASILWQPSKHFSMRTGIDYNDIDLTAGEFITRLFTLRTDVAFSSAWSWSTLAQYDNDTEEVSVNSRLRWIPKAGQEMIFVVNHGFLIDEPIPGAGRDWRSTDSDLVLKATYTFRY